MTIQRRFLPSISCLRALEAVDRLGSAVAAAEDLSLTHSAVSRQLKVLEQQMGVALLVRDGKGLKLTPAGQGYARSIRATLTDLAQSSLRLKAAGERDSLNLALPPAFGLHWMWPRLAEFMRRNPDVLINQSTRLTRFDFARENFDAAVHFGLKDWPGVHYLPLAHNVLVPVAAPALVPEDPEDLHALLDRPLLHLESRPGAWEAWFKMNDIETTYLHGMLFDQFSTLAEAAAAGFGVALIPDFLARREIESGRLVRVGRTFQDAEAMYYLVWPQDAAPANAFEQLRAWFQRESDVTR